MIIFAADLSINKGKGTFRRDGVFMRVSSSVSFCPLYQRKQRVSGFGTGEYRLDIQPLFSSYVSLAKFLGRPMKRPFSASRSTHGSQIYNAAYTLLHHSFLLCDRENTYIFSVL